MNVYLESCIESNRERKSKMDGTRRKNQYYELETKETNEGEREKGEISQEKSRSMKPPSSLNHNSSSSVQVETIERKKESGRKRGRERDWCGRYAGFIEFFS